MSFNVKDFLFVVGVGLAISTILIFTGWLVSCFVFLSFFNPFLYEGFRAIVGVAVSYTVLGALISSVHAQ